jgi:dTDP-4-dehydrorhamnose 3,5-epimerase
MTTATAIPKVLVIEPKVLATGRGFFMEPYDQQTSDDASGHTVSFVPDNHARPAKGVLRGMHSQLPPNAQGKLVRGFLALSDSANFLCNSAYCALQAKPHLRWSDPELAIAWPSVGVAPALSGRDAAEPKLTAPKGSSHGASDA